MTTLKPAQALAVVSDFLEIHLSRVDSPDHFLGDLLSDIQFLADGNTADPASRQEWLDAIEAVTGKGKDALLTSEQAFEAMKVFVGRYGARIKNAKEVSDFLKSLQPLSADRRNEWLACFGKSSTSA